jgi:Cu/Ag efflux protein CusF
MPACCCGMNLRNNLLSLSGFVADAVAIECFPKHVLLLTVSCVLVVIACQGQVLPERLKGTGIVERVVAHDRRVIVAHDDIPGFMPAMTMSFEVKDVALLEELRPGTRIGFVLEKTKETLYMVQVDRLPNSTAP